jgi:hypothetical protein
MQMERGAIDKAQLETEVSEGMEARLSELTDLQLAVVGGGIGDVGFA